MGAARLNAEFPAESLRIVDLAVSGRRVYTLVVRSQFIFPDPLVRYSPLLNTAKNSEAARTD
jgi:hypothetical protein